MYVNSLGSINAANRHALSKLDLYKKKQELLDAQIQHQKSILKCIQTCRNAKKKEDLLKHFEYAAEKITALQNELKTVFQKEKSNSQKSVAERKKELLDAEMDLYKTLNKSQNERDTSALLMKVHELKEKDSLEDSFTDGDEDEDEEDSKSRFWRP